MLEIFEALGVKPTQIAIQIVGFLLLFFVLRKFLWNPILSLMESREKEVEDMLGKAEEAKKMGERLEADYKDRISQIDDEARKYRDEELKRGREMAEQIIKEARDEAEVEKQKALNAIREESRRARMELRDYSVGLSIDIASKVLEEKIDRDSHEQLARKFIDKLDSLN
ncbi:MAG TPA: F0F1 ATP synthase subunit B [bacterium]|nr:F0F1 ATP synthase subunit B [bacterium]HPI77196.1 F0F1 ATP synthase subunit B [bacterium]HPN93057.1 F0F1 ATP synthase subunit B [bacterium]